MSSDRIKRGLVQRLYLVNVLKVNDSDWEFNVEGSTGNIYEVKLCDNISCECIDFSKRKKICKHIYFIIGKVLNKKEWLNNIGENPDINLFDYFFEKSSINLNDYIYERILEKKGDKEKEVEKDIKDIEKEKELQSKKNLDYLCEEVCPICYDNFEKEDLDNKIDDCNICKNYIHIACLKIWLRRSLTCPYCRSSWKTCDKSCGKDNLNNLHTGLEKLFISGGKK